MTFQQCFLNRFLRWTDCFSVDGFNISATYPFQSDRGPGMFVEVSGAPPGSGFLTAFPQPILSCRQASTTVARSVGNFLEPSATPNVEGTGPFGTFGFVESNGSYITFFASDANGAFCTPFFLGACGTNLNPTGINDSGVIAGIFPGDQFGDSSGFVIQNPSCCTQNKAGGVSVSPIAYPGVQPGYGQTTVSGINNGGAMVGTYSYIDSLGDQIQGDIY